MRLIDYTLIIFDSTNENESLVTLEEFLVDAQISIVNRRCKIIILLPNDRMSVQLRIKKNKMPGLKYSLIQRTLKLILTNSSQLANWTLVHSLQPFSNSIKKIAIKFPSKLLINPGVVVLN